MEKVHVEVVADTEEAEISSLMKRLFENGIESVSVEPTEETECVIDKPFYLNDLARGELDVKVVMVLDEDEQHPPFPDDG